MDDFAWKVVSVEQTDRVKEVFCAVVPEAHAFGLSDGLMTGNCVYAPEGALQIAGHAHSELLAKYVAVESIIGHTFKRHLPIAKVAADVAVGVRPSGKIKSWCM